MDVNYLIKLFLPSLSTKNQQLFGIWCVERAFLHGYSNSILEKVLNFKKGWINGEISDKELYLQQISAINEDRRIKTIYDQSRVYSDFVSYSTLLVVSNSPTYLEIHEASCCISMVITKINELKFDSCVEQIAQLCQILTMLGEQVKK